MEEICGDSASASGAARVPGASVVVEVMAVQAVGTPLLLTARTLKKYSVLKVRPSVER